MDRPQRGAGGGGGQRNANANQGGAKQNPKELLASYLNPMVDESALYGAFQSMAGPGGIRLRLDRATASAVIIFENEETALAAASKSVGGEFSLGASNCMVTYMGSKQRPSGPGGSSAGSSSGHAEPAAGSTEAGGGYEWDAKSGYYYHAASDYYYDVSTVL